MMEFATKAIHAGQDPAKWTHRAVVPPISMSTTFQQYAPAQNAVSFFPLLYLSVQYTRRTIYENKGFHDYL